MPSNDYNAVDFSCAAPQVENKQQHVKHLETTCHKSLQGAHLF